MSRSTRPSPPCRPRRTVLSLLVLLLTAVSPATDSRACEPSTDHDVVIIGAGAAGLYAAYELTNLGYDVVVLEASDKHGGRLGSMELGDVRIELGAETLYGPRNNFVFDDIADLLGNDAQLPIFTGAPDQDTLISMDGGDTCWEDGGDCWLDPDIVDYWDFYDEAYAHDADATDRLVSEYLETDWGVPSWHRAYHLYDSVGPGGEYGTSVDQLGLRSLSRDGNMWDMSGNLFGLAPMGYLETLDALYFDSVLDRVMLSSPVAVVDTSGVKPVAVDANGIHHYGDAVIVTVSLGVLKAGYIDFVPDLPSEKLAAINTLGMGKGMKLFLRFSEQFWDDQMFLAVTEGPAGMCWVPGKYQPGTIDPVLTCFIVGQNAETMTALPDDDARANQALSDLDAMFGDAATPAYVSSVVQDWSNEPFVLGSYSHPAPGSYPDGGPNMRQLLARPVDGTLYFAGEATHQTAAATVPGALRSGQRAAGEVAATLGGPPDVARPTADFSLSVLSGSAPLDVSFMDLSSPAATEWSWTFGDGGESADPNPSYQYTVPGTYSVSLTATNANGSHVRVKPTCVRVSAASGGRLQAVQLDAPWPARSAVFANLPCTVTSDLRICDESPGLHVRVNDPVFPETLTGDGSLTFVEYDMGLGGTGDASLIDVRKGSDGSLVVSSR